MFTKQTEYFMPACGNEFYLLVFNSISNLFAALTREILSSTLEDKNYIPTRRHVISSISDLPIFIVSDNLPAKGGPVAIVIP